MSTEKHLEQFLKGPGRLACMRCRRQAHALSRVDYANGYEMLCDPCYDRHMARKRA